MKARWFGLLGLGLSAFLGPAPGVQAAELSTEVTALSAEVRALRARQLAIQDDLSVIREQLAELLKRSPGAAPSAPEPTASAAQAGDDDATASLRKELAEMKRVVDGFKKRDEDARRARAPVRDVKFDLAVGEDPFKGSESARITLVEFTDFQCPYCARHKKTVMPQLMKNYVETGKLRYVLRDYPLAFHKDAPKAHEASHCAREQDRYWEMHEQLFANQRALAQDRLPGYAQAAGVADMDAFRACLDSGRYAERNRSSLEEGGKLGVRGTPSFLLGEMAADGKTVKLTKFIRGAQGYKVFRDAIEGMLSASGS